MINEFGVDETSAADNTVQQINNEATYSSKMGESISNASCIVINDAANVEDGVTSGSEVNNNDPTIGGGESISNAKHVRHNTKRGQAQNKSRRKEKKKLKQHSIET